MNNITPIHYKNTVVATTQITAEFLGTEERRLTNNYLRNKSKFIRDKHFLTLDHDTSKRVVQNYKGTKGLILWTERGCARHSKLLQTQESWDLWESMEDTYFAAKKSPAQPLSLEEMTLQVIQGQQVKIEAQQKAIEAKDELIVASNEASIKAGEIMVREFVKEYDFIDIGEKLMYRWMRVQGYLMKSNEPYQRYRARGYFHWKPTEEEFGGKIRHRLFITPRGKVWLASKYLRYLDNGEAA